MKELFIAMCVVGLMLAYALWECVQKRKRRQMRKERRKREFGCNPLEMPQASRCRDMLDEIAVYYEETKNELPMQQVDDVTWNDLEMDEVFLRINHTRSYIGEQVLYRRLHAVGMHTERLERVMGEVEQAILNRENQTVSKHSMKEWERHIAYFSEQEEEREELEELLEGIGKTYEDYYLPMFLKNTDSLKVARIGIYRFLQILLFGSLLAAVCFSNPYCFAVTVVTALINLSVYALGKEKYEVYLYALGSVKQLVTLGKTIAGKSEWSELFLDEKTKSAITSLEKLTRFIGNFQGKKKSAWTGDVSGMLWDYIIGVTLWDFTIFHRIVGMIEGKQKELFLLYEMAGQIDMEIAVASFRKSLPEYCVPILTKTEEEKQKSGARERHKPGARERQSERHVSRGIFRAKNLYHPLLNSPVCNDFFPEKNCMITGANASGKSTFIKAVAVNAILAQTIYTVTASEFEIPYMQVITSMAVRDDIMSGESYYIKEVGYLKRIVDAVAGVQEDCGTGCGKESNERDRADVAQRREGAMPVLCVIDEILRGTNTKERLAASEAVCRYLTESPCLAIVATHDMELAESLEEQYGCYYFMSEIRDEDIYFDYKIREGYGKNSNAIQLLSYMKFPEEIVGMAQKLV